MPISSMVVSNTSPLSNLAVIDRLDILRAQISEIVIPIAVREELMLLPRRLARDRIEYGIKEGWITVKPGRPPATPFSVTLHGGETAALALALQEQAELVLLDESAARAEAARLGLKITGVLGILRTAKVNGVIPSLTEEIRKLRAEARFFIAPALERRLLSSVDE